MKRCLVISTLFVFSLFSSTAAEKPAVTIDGEVPDFSLSDNAGKTYTLSDYRGSYVVLEWTNPDCPFVKKHYDSKNMQELQKKYTAEKVVWFSICSSAEGKQGHYTGKQLDKRLKAMKPAHTAYLIDANGKVGRQFGAKTTPHMYIIDPEGTLVYTGAIDNRPSTKKEDIDGAINYVTAAFDELLAGKDVTVKATKSYGCSVKY